MAMPLLHKLFVGLSLFACSTVFATPLVVNVAGIESYALLGDPGNTVLSFNLGANAHITSVDFSLELTATSPSWLSEMTLQITDSSGSAGIVFTPGDADHFAGTASYMDGANLVDLGLDFNVGADGILNLQFYETFDDFANAADGQWNAGTLTLGVADTQGQDVPEPASVLLLGAGLVLLVQRRAAAQDRGVAAAQ